MRYADRLNDWSPERRKQAAGTARSVMSNSEKLDAHIIAGIGYEDI
jgi:hypothetical protein